MDIAIILTIIGIVVATAIGGWQIYLAWQQIQLSKQQNNPTNQAKAPSVEGAGNRPQPSRISDEQNSVTNQAQVTNVEESRYRTQPYPNEIVDDIDKLPIAQRNIVRNGYIGLKVKWRTTLQHIEIKSDDNARLMMLDRGKYPWIYCSIDVSKHPEAKLVREGHGIWLAGQISEVRDNEIDLVNCRVRFD